MKTAVIVLAGILSLQATVCAYSHGDGSDSNPYWVSNTADLVQLASTPADWDKAFVLTKDLDLTGVALSPIGNWGQAFVGVFDGAGFTLSHLTMNLPNAENVGLFGLVRSPAVIQGIRLENVSIAGKSYIGALAGWNEDGTITDCSASGMVSGANAAGGLVGVNEGTMSHCFCTAAVSTSHVSRSQAGGLAATNYGDISDCYASGSVTVNGYTANAGGLAAINDHGTIVRSYATGAVQADSTSDSAFAGGLAALNESGTIDRCYAQGDVTASCLIGSGASAAWSSAGGLVGYNRKGMITRSYATGFAQSDASVAGNNQTNCWSSAGGIAADNTGTIDNCYAAGASNASAKVVSPVPSSAWAACGGVVGRNRGVVATTELGQVSTCYTTGAVKAIASVSSEDSVSHTYVGGIIGENGIGTVQRCFWDVDTSGIVQGTGDGAGTITDLYGKTTLEMQTRSTYTDFGWDFVGEAANGGDDIWRLCANGVTYPYFNWNRAIAADFACPDGVAYEDFGYLAARWQMTDCHATSGCGGADLDGSGQVNLADLERFVDVWLAGL
ncbi:MAG TPA: GLUG motif-containing protein [Anaerohalosphaeraceae bacterium]|nr:GLUG motif-containing protein [Anaerohalosphaeraceae bacterium]